MVEISGDQDIRESEKGKEENKMVIGSVIFGAAAGVTSKTKAQGTGESTIEPNVPVVVSGIEFEYAWAKNVGSICSNNDYLLKDISNVNVGPTGTTLFEELAKIVLEKVGGKYYDLPPAQKEEAVINLAVILGKNFDQNKQNKLSDLMSYLEGASHKNYCWTYDVSWLLTYGKPLPEKIDLGITNQAVLNILSAVGQEVKSTEATKPTPPPVKTKAPEAPTKLIVDSKTSNSCTVSWMASSGASKYEVLAKDGKSVPVKEATGIKATIPGLDPNTKYTITVKAVNEEGKKSAASNGVECTTEEKKEKEEKKPKKGVCDGKVDPKVVDNCNKKCGPIPDKNEREECIVDYQ